MTTSAVLKSAGLFILSFLSPWVLAHPGHGGDAGAVHDMEHTLWVLLGVSAVVIAALLVAHKKWGLWK
ncbi:hypothetical protein KOI40_03985 [Aestuariicella sp. G3-2]|uniref:hypothetical protein n=1 Tax=Pseudomaricurvus albidus TaxID=2842452 RepID=UPI001C0AC1A9|nr:hypothetical protein [Aestuariicella albida]MBU3068965.1 hypothetical protein [Aestuariicella albida]